MTTSLRIAFWTMSDEEWTVVKGRRRSCRRVPPCHSKNSAHQLQQKLSQEFYSPTDISCRVDKLHDTFAEIKKELRHSDFFRRIQALISRKDFTLEFRLDETPHAAAGGGNLPSTWHWAKVTQMVIFGLGSVNSHPAPRYQLALALLVAELLPGLGSAVEAYDPVFDPVDRAFLERVSVKVLTENEQGKRVASSPTLFYLPHCEGGLCSNVLRANAGSLGNIAILGNSFRSYYDQWSWKDKAAKQHSHEDWGWGPIVDLVEHEGVTERVISDKDSPAVSNSRPFNDMSLHLFTEPLQPRPG